MANFDPATFDLESATFSINPQYRLQWEAAQNCHVLLYPEGLVQLSDSAAAILQHCVEPTTLISVVETLQQQFPDAEGIADDIKEFLIDAQEQCWIVTCN